MDVKIVVNGNFSHKSKYFIYFINETEYNLCTFKVGKSYNNDDIVFSIM